MHRKIFRILYAIFFTLLLAGCVTMPEKGTGPLILTKESEKSLIRYFAAPEHQANNYWHGVFLINPKTNKVSWHYSSNGNTPRNRSITNAMKKCDSGCRIFAEGKKIVWDGFTDKKKYDLMAKSFENNNMIDVENYDSSNFEISYFQLYQFKNKYIPRVKKSPKGVWAFAISPNGNIAEWLEYRVEMAGYKRPHTARAINALQRTTIAICNAISGENSCVIYADNETLVGE